MAFKRSEQEPRHRHERLHPRGHDLRFARHVVRGMAVSARRRREPSDRGDGSRVRGDPRDAPGRLRRALRRRPASRSSSSTTAAGATARASRAACSTSRCSTRTGAPRSPTPGRLPASTRTPRRGVGLVVRRRARAAPRRRGPRPGRGDRAGPARQRPGVSVLGRRCPRRCGSRARRCATRSARCSAGRRTASRPSGEPGGPGDDDLAGRLPAGHAMVGDNVDKLLRARTRSRPASGCTSRSTPRAEQPARSPPRRSSRSPPRTSSPRSRSR